MSEGAITPLKGCPFCGKEPNFLNTFRNNFHEYTITCSDCRCHGPYYKSEDMCKEAWNTRKQSPSSGSRPIHRDSLTTLSLDYFYAGKDERKPSFKVSDFIDGVCSKFGTKQEMPSQCVCVYESDCHGIEMIKSPSGKEWAIGGTNTKDRWKFCPWCGGEIK